MSKKEYIYPKWIPGSRFKYRLSEEIGSGAYGVVYKGFRDDDDKQIAMKRIFVTDKDGNHNIPLSTHRELCALRKLNVYDNKNIVELYDVVINTIDNRMCMDLIFELEDYDLEKYLKEFNSRNEMPMSQIINLSKQLLDAVYFMHSYCVVHRDLKPANILINKRGTELKITDFGLARILGFDASLTPVVVTLWYRSPEILLQRSYLTGCDVWSSGCIIAEMLYGTALFQGDSELSQLERIVRRLGKDAIDNWPSDTLVDRNSLMKLVDKSESLDYILRHFDKSLVKLVKDLLRFKSDDRILTNEASIQLDNITRKLFYMNGNSSNLSSFSCSHLNGDHNYADHDEIDNHSMIVNSVVQKVFDSEDEIDHSLMMPQSDSLIPGIDDNESIEFYPHKEIIIADTENSPSLSSSSSSSHCLSDTESCELEDEEEHESEKENDNESSVHLSDIVPPPLKDSDEVGDSFSSYRSQNNYSFSSYAPSSLTGAETTDDDEEKEDEIAPLTSVSDKASLTRVSSAECSDDSNKAVVDVNEINNFTISNLGDNYDHPSESQQTSVSSCSGSANSFFLPNQLTRTNSTPFKEVNLQSRLNGSNQSSPKEVNFIRKRNLSLEDSSGSENEINYLSPIAMKGIKLNLCRQRVLRRRVSMLEQPLNEVCSERKCKNSLLRTGSVLIPSISENDECRDMSFGERSLSQALESIKSSDPPANIQLSDRPKIVVRRRSTMRKN